jgi:hypothetical protein
MFSPCNLQPILSVALSRHRARAKSAPHFWPPATLGPRGGIWTLPSNSRNPRGYFTRISRFRPHMSLWRPAPLWRCGKPNQTRKINLHNMSTLHKIFGTEPALVPRASHAYLAISLSPWAALLVTYYFQPQVMKTNLLSYIRSASTIRDAFLRLPVSQTSS